MPIHVDAVGGIIQEVGLHLVGKVQNDDDLFEGTGVLGRLDAFQQANLFGGKLEIVAIGGIPGRAVHIIQRTQRAVTARHIAAFTADTGDDHNGGITKLGKAGAVGGLHLVPGRLANHLDAGDTGAGLAHHPLVTCLFFGGVPVPQGVVDGKIPVALQRRLEGGCGRSIHCTGPGAAVDRVNTADAKQTDIALLFGQGKGIVVIFQQHSALCHGFLAQGLAGGNQLFQILKPGLEILGVLGAVAGFDGPEGGRVQKAVDLRGVLVGDHAARIADAAQHCQQQRHRLAQAGDRPHRQTSRRNVQHQPRHIQGQGDKEIRLPGGVDPHKGGRNIGIQAVNIEQKRDKVGGGQHRRGQRALPEHKQHRRQHQADAHGPDRLPGHTVHAALYGPVQQDIDDHADQRKSCACGRDFGSTAFKQFFHVITSS